MLRWGNLQKLKTFASLAASRHVNCRTASTKQPATVNKPETKPATEENPYPTKSKIWISYGYDDTNKEADRHYMHSTMFFSVTVCLVLGGFILCYIPDPQLQDWARREAYLQLRFREENGLPLIDPNYIDPAKIKLPTDEELGDMEIII